MKNFFKQLFDDNNSINEKALVGFIAFFMLCIASVDKFLNKKDKHEEDKDIEG